MELEKSIDCPASIFCEELPTPALSNVHAAVSLSPLVSQPANVGLNKTISLPYCQLCDTLLCYIDSAVDL